jgi:hypothetical protein
MFERKRQFEQKKKSFLRVMERGTRSYTRRRNADFDLEHGRSILEVTKCSKISKYKKRNDAVARKHENVEEISLRKECATEMRTN